jgi:reactive chlorine resistance protein C
LFAGEQCVGTRAAILDASRVREIERRNQTEEGRVHSSIAHTPVPFRLSPAHRIEAAGAGIVRWSIVFLLLFFGALKWTAAEADAIAPFIVNSPALRWIGFVFGRQGASEVIGVLELAIAVLIALRRWAPRLAMVGGFLGAVMFLTTLSFLVTTPGLGDGAAFLMKDLPLLGGALWTAGEAWAAVERQDSGVPS